MGQTAAMIGGSLASSALSSQGGKKAAKAAQPRIPAEFRGSLGGALGLINQRLSSGFPRFGGPFVAGLNPLQQGAIGAGSSFLGAGSEGLLSALKTTQEISETGLDQETLKLIEDKLAPFFSRQRERVTTGTREAEAQGGRFFSTGAVGAESTGLADLEATQSATVLPLALQVQGLRLGAAESSANIFGSGGVGLNQMFGLGEGARSVEQAGLTADFQEFLRTQPDNAIGMLASLMTGTPFVSPNVAPNFMQGAGANLGSMFSSPAFLQFLFGNK